MSNITIDIIKICIISKSLYLFDLINLDSNLRYTFSIQSCPLIPFIISANSLPFPILRLNFFSASDIDDGLAMTRLYQKWIENKQNLEDGSREAL